MCPTATIIAIKRCETKREQITKKWYKQYKTKTNPTPNSCHIPLTPTNPQPPTRHIAHSIHKHRQQVTNKTDPPKYVHLWKTTPLHSLHSKTIKLFIAKTGIKDFFNKKNNKEIIKSK